jgi:hypothetical protein
MEWVAPRDYRAGHQLMLDRKRWINANANRDVRPRCMAPLPLSGCHIFLLMAKPLLRGQVADVRGTSATPDSPGLRETQPLSQFFALQRLFVDCGREHAPAAVVVTEEEQSACVCRVSGLDPHVAPSAITRAAEFGDPNRNRRARRQPFIYQKPQGSLARRPHDPLQSRSS